MAEKELDLRSDFQKNLDKFKERIKSEFLQLRETYTIEEWSNERLCGLLAKTYGKDAKTIRRHLKDEGVLN